MTFKTLNKLFPSAVIQEQRSEDENLLQVFSEEQYLTIPLRDLKESEIALIRALFPDVQAKSHWYHYFINEVLIHNRSLIEYQVIQFKTELETKNQDLWLTTLVQYFESYEDAFFIDETSGMIVMKKQTIDATEVQGFVQTLDDDFSSKTSLYIGQAKLLGEAHISQVKEEREIFLKLEGQFGVHSFRSAYIDTLLRPALELSKIVTSLRDKILQQTDAHELIKTLWQNQANITKTSKDLFLHRNTLNYRLDKFYEEVGLSLRDLDDLLLCYLVIV